MIWSRPGEEYAGTLVLDGAMATEFRRMGHDVCGEQLVLRDPGAVSAFHKAYIEAGADVIKTVTFGASPLSPVPEVAEGYAEIIRGAVGIARSAIEDAGMARRVMVAGDMGPGFMPLSGASPEDYRRWVSAFAACAEQFMLAGADLLMVETLYDAANARAVAQGITEAQERCGKRVPVMFSATVRGDGCLPSGHTLRDFVEAVECAGPVAVGLNCCEGPEGIAAPLLCLSETSSLPVFAFPSAGLPGISGEYPYAPAEFASAMSRLSEAVPLLLAGGCCGTTPDHIRLLARLFHDG